MASSGWRAGSSRNPGCSAVVDSGDGAAIAAAFLVSTRLGLATTLAVVVHEMPQEVGDHALLRDAGLPRSTALVGLAAVQLTAGAGAAAVAIGTQAGSWLGVVLSLAGGTFVYVAAPDLLPVLHEAEEPRERDIRLAGFLVGLAVLARLALL